MLLLLPVLVRDRVGRRLGARVAVFAVGFPLLYAYTGSKLLAASRGMVLQMAIIEAQHLRCGVNGQLNPISSCPQSRRLSAALLLGCTSDIVFRFPAPTRLPVRGRRAGTSLPTLTGSAGAACPGSAASNAAAAGTAAAGIPSANGGADSVIAASGGSEGAAAASAAGPLASSAAVSPLPRLAFARLGRGFDFLTPYGEAVHLRHWGSQAEIRTCKNSQEPHDHAQGRHHTTICC